MYKIAKLFSMVCETPLHAGSGNDLGVIDLPIQRERHTGFPKIEGSSLKGTIREAFEGLEGVVINKITPNIMLNNKKLNEAINYTFGPDEGDLYAGSLGFTDAKLLLFPVKSMKGVFAWITCPLVLERFYKDLERCNIKFDLELPGENSTSLGSGLFVKDNKIILEEYTFEINTCDNCSKFAEWVAKNILPEGKEYDYLREKLKKDLVVLPNDDFSDFVNLSTEVVTRTKISPITGTVEKGALFTEEYLPAETILYALSLSTAVFNDHFKEHPLFKLEGREEEKVMKFFEEGIPNVIQLGGNATLGKGLIRTRFVEVNQNE